MFYEADATWDWLVEKMFATLHPQKVRHSDGFIVQSKNRNEVEYVEPNRSAFIFVEFSKIVGIYAKTLSQWHKEAGTMPMGADDANLVVARIAAGLEAMGCEVEIC